MAALKKNDIATIKRIYQETVSDPSRGHGWVSEAEGAALVPVHVVVNTSIVNPANPSQVHALVTAAGAEAAGLLAPQAATAPASAPVEQAAKPVYSVVAVALPPSTRGGSGGRGSQYPFDNMEIGTGFFLPEDGTEAFAKTKASTVSAANKRLAPKRFTSRALSADRAAEIFNADGTDRTGGKGGVGVFRVADVA